MSEISVVEIQNDLKVIGVRISKTINGKDAGFHRITILPGQDQKAVSAAVDQHLGSMGVDAVADWSPAAAMVTATHTPAVIAAFHAAQAAASSPAGNITPAGP